MQEKEPLISRLWAWLIMRETTYDWPLSIARRWAVTYETRWCYVPLFWLRWPVLMWRIRKRKAVYV